MCDVDEESTELDTRKFYSSTGDCGSGGVGYI